MRTSDHSDGGTVETSISLPIAVRELLRQTATDNGTTITETILSAVDATAPVLKDLVDADRPTTAAAHSLFPDRAPKARSAEPRTTAPLLTTRANLNILDKLTKDSGATSRSHLITLALRHHLDRT